MPSKHELVETLYRLSLPGKLYSDPSAIPAPEKSKDQNFLIDRETINTIADLVKPDSTVVEIGPGVGLLTEALAKRTKRLIGVELDPDFQLSLSSIHTRFPQTNFSFGDALNALDMTRIAEADKIQVVSNLPFGIVTRFMAKLAGTPIHNAVFFLGDDSAKEIKETDTQSPHYGHKSLIAQTFFTSETVASVGPDIFYPMPETTGEIVVMTPTPSSEIGITPQSSIFSQIIRDTQPPAGVQGFTQPSVLKSISRALLQPEANLLGRIQGFKERSNRVPQQLPMSDLLQQPFLELGKQDVGRMVSFIGHRAHILSRRRSA